MPSSHNLALSPDSILPHGAAPPPLQPATFWTISPPHPGLRTEWQWTCPVGFRIQVTYAEANFIHGAVGNANNLALVTKRNGNPTNFTTTWAVHIAGQAETYIFAMTGDAPTINKQIHLLFCPLPRFMILEPGDTLHLQWQTQTGIDDLTNIHVAGFAQRLAPDRSRFQRLLNAIAG